MYQLERDVKYFKFQKHPQVCIKVESKTQTYRAIYVSISRKNFFFVIRKLYLPLLLYFLLVVDITIVNSSPMSQKVCFLLNSIWKMSKISRKCCKNFFLLIIVKKKSQKKYKFENNLIFDINEINFNLILDSLTNF